VGRSRQYLVEFIALLLGVQVRLIGEVSNDKRFGGVCEAGSVPFK